MAREDFIWAEKYRPKTIEDCVLPKALKGKLLEIRDSGQIPNMLFVGPSGVGKTTAAIALCEEIDAHYVKINASLHGNIDTLRTQIQSFAETMSYNFRKKYVILDEADGLNAHHFQPALRAFIEDYSKNCGFILTANNANRIIPALRSRDATVYFKIMAKEIPAIQAAFYKRVTDILTKENIAFEMEPVGYVIQKFFPDFRRMLNELQFYAKSGKIDTGIMSAAVSAENFDRLFKLLKGKKWAEIRKWTADNLDLDFDITMRTMYDMAVQYFKDNALPTLVLIMAKYQYQNAFAADREINLLAMLTEIMVECEFK